MTDSDTLQPTPLLHSDWQYVRKATLEEFNPDDWAILARQKKGYLAERQADEVLRMLKAQKDDPAFGYTTNNYQHCLLTATRMLKDKLPEEDVVVGLLHDIGYMVCPNSHGEYAAVLLRPYISERNHWMLLHHEVFQMIHINLPGDVDQNAREQWRGNPHFDWTEKFLALYDQTTFSYAEEAYPIEVFEPMVRRLFAKDCSPEISC